MPLFHNDYLADTAHLSTEEHGAYLLLIINYWQREGPLPSDDKRLAAITRMHIKDWQKIKPDIEQFFDVRCDGNADAMRWHHGRIDHELKIVRARSSKARASANARWNKDKNAVAMPTQSGRNATIQYKTIKKEKKDTKVSKEKTVRASRLPDNWQPKSETVLWCKTEMDWTPQRLDSTIGSFRDYWHGEGGQKARKVDWDRAFKFWCRREGKSSKPNGSGKVGWGETAKDMMQDDQDRNPTTSLLPDGGPAKSPAKRH
jgi:uncharacterized protein YdaU (DUF1376 family)